MDPNGPFEGGEKESTDRSSRRIDSLLARNEMKQSTRRQIWKGMWFAGVESISQSTRMAMDLIMAVLAANHGVVIGLSHMHEENEDGKRIRERDT